jgi:hypothetical protein
MGTSSVRIVRTQFLSRLSESAVGVSAALRAAQVLSALRMSTMSRRHRELFGLVNNHIVAPEMTAIFLER